MTDKSRTSGATVTDHGDRAEISFPFDRARVEALKAAFPKARFVAANKTWSLAGKTAAKRLAKWAEQTAPAIDPDLADQRGRDALLTFGPRPSCHWVSYAEREIMISIPKMPAATALVKTLPTASWAGSYWSVRYRDAEALVALIPELNAVCDPPAEAWEAAKAGGRRISTAHVTVSGNSGLLRDGVLVTLPYAEAAIGILKDLNGAWSPSRRCWTVPYMRIPALLDAMPRLEAIAADAAAVAAAETADRSVAQAAARAAAVRPSLVWLADTAPADGATLRIGDRVLTVTGRTRPFRDDMDAGPVLGSDGSLDEAWCVRLWVRNATAEEAAALQAEEAARAAAAARVRRQRDLHHAAADRLRREGTCPPPWVDPQGEQLGPGPSLLGAGDWFVINDREIWYVQNNGMDGDNWSANNVRTGGAGAIGWFLPYEPELAAAIREAWPAAEPAGVTPGKRD